MHDIELRCFAQLYVNVLIVDVYLQQAWVR